MKPKQTACRQRPHFCIRAVASLILLYLWLSEAVLAQGAPLALRADPIEVDFGRVTQQQVLVAKVKLTNEGEEPLAIVSMTTDCECISASSPAAWLKAGEAATITIKAEARTQRGQVQHMVIVHASTGDIAVPVKMWVAPSSFGNWMVEPFPIALPTWDREHETRVELTLRHLGKTAVAITRLTASKSWVKVEIKSTEVGVANVKLTRIAGAPAGYHTVRVEAETTDSANPRFAFDVLAPVVPDLVMNPNPIVMPTVKVGEVSARTVKLSGWLRTTPPRFDLSDGTVVAAAVNDESMAFRVEMRMVHSGKIERTLQIYEGDDLRSAVPVVLIVENSEAPTAPKPASAP